jgi:hypothetical protein
VGTVRAVDMRRFNQSSMLFSFCQRTCGARRKICLNGHP